MLEKHLDVGSETGWEDDKVSAGGAAKDIGKAVQAGGRGERNWHHAQLRTFQT